MFTDTKEMDGSKFGNETFSCLLCRSLTHWILVELLEWRETNFVYIIPLCGNLGPFYLKKLLVSAKPPERQNSSDNIPSLSSNQEPRSGFLSGWRAKGNERMSFNSRENF